MKLANVFASFAVLASVSYAQFTASYETAYDNPQRSLSTVACSDGANGLLTRNFTTLGSLPSYPNVGGVPAVTGWNSPDCGTCWTVTYTNAQGIAKSINLLAIDSASNFNMASAAMNSLTDDQATSLGRVPVTAISAPQSSCGLPRFVGSNSWQHLTDIHFTLVHEEHFIRT